MNNSFSLYGAIDLTVLGELVRKHPQLVREVSFKDGTTHKFINIDINERQQPSDRGATHYMKCSCKKDLQVQGLKYYIADLKPSQFNNAPATPIQAAPATSVVASPQRPEPEQTDLPF